MKNTQYHIFLDLDGVFADFESRMSECTDHVPWSLTSSEMWAAINAYNNNVQPFFLTLDLMPDALRLWQFVVDNFENYSFLSAKGTGDDDYAEQKAAWVAKNISSTVVVECVERGAEKFKHAAAHTLLVDDMKRNTDNFVQAGGLAIVHTSVDDTIAKLQKLLEGTYEY